MLGGLRIVVSDHDAPTQLGIEPPDELRLALLIPEFSMPTQESRKALPERLTRNQAVQQHRPRRDARGRDRPATLRPAATGDRGCAAPAGAGAAIPADGPDLPAARDAGSLGVYLSGGGSTIAAFGTAGLDDIAGAMRETAASHGYRAETRICALSAGGAELLPDAQLRPDSLISIRIRSGDTAMALVVQKYGGSSVADAERIRHVAKRIAARARRGGPGGGSGVRDGARPPTS